MLISIKLCLILLNRTKSSSKIYDSSKISKFVKKLKKKPPKYVKFVIIVKLIFDTSTSFTLGKNLEKLYNTLYEIHKNSLDLPKNYRISKTI